MTFQAVKEPRAESPAASCGDHEDAGDLETDQKAADRLNPPAAHLWNRPKRNPGPSTGQAIGDIMVG